MTMMDRRLDFGYNGSRVSYLLQDLDTIPMLYLSTSLQHLDGGNFEKESLVMNRPEKSERTVVIRYT